MEPRTFEDKGMNAIKCLYCGTVIESKHQHDFVTHACETMKEKRGEDYFIFVDGGKYYNRRGGNPGKDYEELDND